RLPRFAGQLGVQAAVIEIRDQKRRWGSCSRSGILRFNWRIVASPVAVLDYLLVHELCHLIHPDHSLRFWNQVQILIPDFEKKRVLLKEHGLIAGELG
ncbi:MAG: M48 family metallopeptidase, partial [Pseudomonadota bacterium]